MVADIVVRLEQRNTPNLSTGRRNKKIHKTYFDTEVVAVVLYNLWQIIVRFFNFTVLEFVTTQLTLQFENLSLAK
jgi:hypothetical protein